MKILSSHGSGGKLTQELIKKLFLKYFDSAELRELDDGTLFNGEKCEYAVSTDSFVVTPVFFTGGNIGKLSVAGTVNDLAAMGAEPVYLTVGFILQEGLEVDELEQIVASMAKSARQVGARIITGDTKVVEGNKDTKPGLFINTTGIGKTYKSLSGMNSIKPGDRILINGGIAEHGFSILGSRLKMGESVKSDCEPLWELVKTVLSEIPVKFMRDPTRGGIAAVLNEVIEGREIGIKIHENDIPIKEEVLGLSEILGITPFEVASEGRMVFFVEADYANQVLKIMKSHPLGMGSAKIGEVVAYPQGKVILESPYGLQRILSMPLGENLPRIC